MPLPNLPAGYQAEAYEQLIRYLPGHWFHLLEDGRSPIGPILEGASFALAHLRHSYEQAQRASIPTLSGGPWLSLHLQGIGLERLQSESDENAIDRYIWEFKPTRNTREGELLALEHYFGLTAPRVRIETDRGAGKLGQFRLVLDDRDKPWNELDYSFLGEFIRRYVSNGITPSIDAKLQCLIFAPLPAWQFHDQFPTSWNIQGPLWERPVFQNPLRLEFARNLITQVSAPEWRAERDRLTQLFLDGVADAPGAMFLYLSDQGNCPNLLTTFDLEIETVDIGGLIPNPEFDVDGWHFWDGFLTYEPTITGLFAPFLEVPSFGLVDAFPAVDIPDLYEAFPGSGDPTTSLQLAYQYDGLDFTRYQVIQFFDVPGVDLDPIFDSGNYRLMQTGPWQLRLSTGSSSWGNFPPGGSVFVGPQFALLNPESIWWSDAAGVARSPVPIRDPDNNIYLHIEFLLPKGVARTIRELELTLFGDRIEYRRFSLPIPESLNCGFIFRVQGLGSAAIDALDLGDGSVLDLEFGGRLDMGNGAWIEIGDESALDLGFGNFLKVN